MQLYALNMRSGGNKFNYFCVFVTSVLTKKWD